MRWIYALWRVVSGRAGRGHRILRPTFGQPVSARWLREETYRSGQNGIDGPSWPWPIGANKAPTDVASRSSIHQDRSDEEG
jgi:hypothetical protein